MEVVLTLFNNIMREKALYYENRINLNLILPKNNERSKFEENNSTKLTFNYLKSQEYTEKQRNDFIKIDRNKALNKGEETESDRKVKNMSITNFYKTRKKNNSMGDLRSFKHIFNNNNMRNIILDNDEISTNINKDKINKDKDIIDDSEILSQFNRTQKMLFNKHNVKNKLKGSVPDVTQQDEIDSIDQVLSIYKEHLRELNEKIAEECAKPNDLKGLGKTTIGNFRKKSEDMTNRSNFDSQRRSVKNMIDSSRPSKTFYPKMNSVKSNLPLINEKKDSLDETKDTKSDYSSSPANLIKNSIRILPLNLRDKFNESSKLNNDFLKHDKNEKRDTANIINFRKSMEINPTKHEVENNNRIKIDYRKSMMDLSPTKKTVEIDN